MKRLLPLLLVLLLLLAACGTAQESGKDQTLPPESEPGAAETSVPTPFDGPDMDELPILTDDGKLVPADDSGAVAAPALSDTVVTLDGLDSYLRLTLPEGWTWEQAVGTVEGTVYRLRPEDDPDFRVEMQYWPSSFGMCGTGVTFTDYPLPDGRKATLATEEIGDSLMWTLILPESPDSFTIQFSAKKAVYETHRAELELMLGTLQQGVLAGLDVVKPEEVTG